MNYLADVNVWVAFTLVGHTHHAAARQWFEEAKTDEILFCRVTQHGFLRLLTNARVMGANVLGAAQAWSLYDTFLTDSRVRFAAEPPGIEVAWRNATRPEHIGPNFWTDAYLAAFAMTAEVAIVTFDRGFRDHRGVQVRLLRQE